MIHHNFRIFSEGEQFKFNDLREQFYGKYGNLEIPKNNLCLILVENSINSIAGVLTLVDSRVPCIVLPGKVNSGYLQCVVKRFSPYIIYGYTGEPLEGYSLHHEALVKNNSICLAGEIDSNIAMIFPTSGTTGGRKMCVLSRRNILSSAVQITNSLGINSDDVALTTLSPAYIYGFSIILSHAFVGAGIGCRETSVTQKTFLVKENKIVTNLNFVPIQCLTLMKLKYKFENFTNLKFVTQAGGHLPKLSKIEFAKIVNDRNLIFYSMYGQTEASPRISCNKIFNSYKKIESVGVPVLDGEVSIDVTEIRNNRDVGEIIYKGPNVFMGYAESIEDLVSGLPADDILRTRDYGWVDMDGYLYVVGRMDRTIKINGYRIELDSLEEVLTTENQQSKCIINEEGKLCIFTDGPVDLIKRLIRDRVKAININELIISQLDLWPMTETGKISYAVLKKFASRGAIS